MNKTKTESKSKLKTKTTSKQKMQTALSNKKVLPQDENDEEKNKSTRRTFTEKTSTNLKHVKLEHITKNMEGTTNSGENNTNTGILKKENNKSSKSNTKRDEAKLEFPKETDSESVGKIYHPNANEIEKNVNSTRSKPKLELKESSKNNIKNNVSHNKSKLNMNTNNLDTFRASKMTSQKSVNVVDKNSKQVISKNSKKDTISTRSKQKFNTEITGKQSKNSLKTLEKKSISKSKEKDDLKPELNSTKSEEEVKESFVKVNDLEESIVISPTDQKSNTNPNIKNIENTVNNSQTGSMIKLNSNNLAIERVPFFNIEILGLNKFKTNERSSETELVKNDIISNSVESGNPINKMKKIMNLVSVIESPRDNNNENKNLCKVQFTEGNSGEGLIKKNSKLVNFHNNEASFGLQNQNFDFCSNSLEEESSANNFETEKLSKKVKFSQVIDENTGEKVIRLFRFSNSTCKKLEGSKSTGKKLSSVEAKNYYYNVPKLNKLSELSKLTFQLGVKHGKKKDNSKFTSYKNNRFNSSSDASHNIINNIRIMNNKNNKSLNQTNNEATDNYINIINNNNKTYIYDSATTKQNNISSNNKLNIENLYLNSNEFKSENDNKIDDLIEFKKAFFNQQYYSNYNDYNNFSSYNSNVNLNNSLNNNNNLKSTITITSNRELNSSRNNKNNLKESNNAYSYNKMSANNHLDYLKSLKQKNIYSSSEKMNIVNSVNRVSKTKNLNSDLIFQLNYKEILEKQKFKEYNSKNLNNMNEKEFSMKGVKMNFKQKVFKAEQKITNKIVNQKLISLTEFNFPPAKFHNSKLNEKSNLNLLTCSINNPKQNDGLTIKGNELLQKLNSKIKGFS